MLRTGRPKVGRPHFEPVRAAGRRPAQVSSQAKTGVNRTMMHPAARMAATRLAPVGS